MISVFISYSHVDEGYRKELDKHLEGLRRQGVISIWHDRRIGPGEEVHEQISQKLEEANIILLLISSDFLASNYCYDVEMTRAMERHEQGAARVIPVILRPCDWQNAPFGGLYAVPTDGKPVAKHATLDDGFLEVTRAVRQAAESLGGGTSTRARPVEGTVTTLEPVQSGPRSSNLSVKRDFTDKDRHSFLNDGFEYVACYFENSLQELQTRNYEVETDFRRIDANRMEAKAFIGGHEKSRCGIWLGGLFGAVGLYFSFNGAGDGNSYNESMSVRDDGYTLFFEPLGMSHLFRQEANKRLTFEGAAEYFWSLFVERLR